MVGFDSKTEIFLAGLLTTQNFRINLAHESAYLMDFACG